MPDAAPREDNTHRESDEDMDQYEVQYSAPPPVEMRPPQPSNLHPFHRAQRLCTELLGMARLGHGWIRESNARHSTMLYSMQADTPSIDHTAGLMRHGRASCEQT